MPVALGNIVWRDPWVAIVNIPSDASSHFQSLISLWFPSFLSFWFLFMLESRILKGHVQLYILASEWLLTTCWRGTFFWLLCIHLIFVYLPFNPTAGTVTLAPAFESNVSSGPEKPRRYLWYLHSNHPSIMDRVGCTGEEGHWNQRDPELFFEIYVWENIRIEIRGSVCGCVCGGGGHSANVLSKEVQDEVLLGRFMRGGVSVLLNDEPDSFLYDWVSRWGDA